MGKRLYLSPPFVESGDVESLLAAIESGWVAPLGPEVDAFEAALCTASGRRYAVALSTGTAALHLGLLAIGVGPGREVVVPTLTFGATAFAVAHSGATPVFLDAEAHSWNLDPDLLADFLDCRATQGRLPAAIITVDLFGRTCDYDRILALGREYDVHILCDAAEALGATHGSMPVGSFGAASVFSFNGNKIITTSGGGALVTDDPDVAGKVRKWATQARENRPWYEHEEIGFNYRMSNLLAALGRSQLSRLEGIVDRRRLTGARYAAGLDGLPGVDVMGDPAWGRWNGWLTTVRFAADVHPNAPTRVREALEASNIESRPVWKPMHQQPVFRGVEAHVTGVADAAFREGLCLPSGTGMTEPEVDEVVEIVRSVLR